MTLHFLHTPLCSFPTKETFVEPENLNGDCEYPLKIHKGLWLSPDEVWTEKARLFHIRSVADYIRVIQMFPYKNQGYNTYENKNLNVLLETYEKFHGWKMDICKKSGLSDDGSVSSQTPLQFYLDAFSCHTTSYKKSRTYRHKTAISQLNKMEHEVLAKIKDYKRGCENLQNQSIFISIDYNAMRYRGYDGIYVHKEAIEEARALPETSRYHYACTVLLFWEVESVWVWRWIFEDL